MGLSSNILWHQTDFNGFKAILKSRCLSCSYCLESLLDDQYKIAFPMISLSDIPLADIGEYLEQYGGYSFGFSRKWVIQNGFNPVWYSEKSNIAMNKHKEILYESLREDKSDIASSVFSLFFYYSSYQKAIEGPLFVKSKNCIYSNYRYYDEREYRFIPDYDSLIKKSISPFLTEKDYNDYKNKKGSSRIEYTIPFSIPDLEIIITKTDKQVLSIRKGLKDIYPDHSVHVFSHREIKQNIIGTGHQIIKEPKGLL